MNKDGIVGFNGNWLLACVGITTDTRAISSSHPFEYREGTLKYFWWPFPKKNRNVHPDVEGKQLLLHRMIQRDATHQQIPGG